MTLAIADVLKDQLVKDTIAALSGKTYRDAPDQEELDEHPVFSLLEKTGGLDSETAAVLVADEMLRSSSDKSLAGLLPRAIQPAVRLLMDSYDSRDNMEGLSNMINSGDDTALKIGTAALVHAATGSEFEYAKRQMGRQEAQETAVQMIDLSIETMEALADNNRWKALPAGLVKMLSEGADNLSEFAEPALRKKLLRQTQQELRDSMAAEGINLPAVMIGKPQAATVQHVKSMQTDDVLSDALVQATMKGMGIGPQEVDMERLRPVFDMLAKADTLDSVTAAALIAQQQPYRTGQLPKEVKEVVDVLAADVMFYAGPMIMFEKDNVTLHKIGLAALVQGLSDDGLRDAQQSGRFETDMKEMTNAVMVASDRIVAAKSWKGMSPELIDQFNDGIEKLKILTEGKVAKKLLGMAQQQLRTEAFKAAAQDLTAPANDNANAAPNKPAFKKPPAPKLRRD